MSGLKLGINGFGRIGRMVFRAASQRGFENFQVVGINHLGSPQEVAHLLKYDSTHGVFPGQVGFSEKNLIVDGVHIPLSHSREPREIPWRDWSVDIVLECTGAFKTKESFMQHCEAGAKRVLVSAPAPGVELTLVYGINHEDYSSEKHRLVSNASCTTNCLAPLAFVLHKNFGISKSLMTTIHSYTNDQRILDSSHKDLRRARAAAMSMIPTTTGAACSVGQVLPELHGKIDGVAIRVPTPNVSLVDFVFESSSVLSVETINGKLLEASTQGKLKGILRCEEAPLVSQDFVGDPCSSIVDTLSTMVMGEHMGKVLAWYDNEVGFSHRMVDMALYMYERGV